MTAPRISVCMTHFNRPEKLGVTLESLARQTRVPDEVFLWDDCSPNDPTAVAMKWKDAFPHFVYHRNERNLNMPGNLNAVISQATGDYIANLHDADEFDPRLIELWAEALARNPSAGMVYCGLESPRPGNAPPQFWLNTEIPPLSDGVVFFENHFLGKWSSPIWGTVMVRKSVYENLLPFREEFRNWADVDMWMRISLSHDMAYVDLPLIRTDEGDTPLRGFDWGKVFIQHRMMESAIRLYCRRTGQSARHYLLRQYFNLLLRWTRHMASGLREQDGTRLKLGVAHFPGVLFNAVVPRARPGMEP
ncbi:MAG: glycosyltransferase family A protein [Terrimicrobiaceae bacterium]